MTYFFLTLVLLVALALVGLVRELRRDPAHHAPCSHVDEFSPRWDGGGSSRWAV